MQKLSLIIWYILTILEIITNNLKQFIEINPNLNDYTLNLNLRFKWYKEFVIHNNYDDYLRHYRYNKQYKDKETKRKYRKWVRRVEGLRQTFINNEYSFFINHPKLNAKLLHRAEFNTFEYYYDNSKYKYISFRKARNFNRRYNYSNHKSNFYFVKQEEWENHFLTKFKRDANIDELEFGFYSDFDNFSQYQNGNKRYFDNIPLAGII